jgi:C-terminal processing protease CtpA/Prc
LKYEYQDAVWRGPLIVLVNGGTGSTAEQFTAELQDNLAAIVIGAPTAGAGCGHTDGGTPTTLHNSGAVLELPDCARLRKDGSNEVMGIQPDVLIGLRNEDGPHRRAFRISQKLSEAVNRAVSMSAP